mgnify:CR=1 FL=1
MKRLICIMILVFLAGCMSSEDEWTREKQESVTTRILTNVSTSQAISAAERVFRLADSKDVSFDYRPNGFVAERKSFFYFIIGGDFTTYVFDVHASAVQGGTRLTMRASAKSTTTTVAGVSPSGGALNRAEGLYQLFFSRLAFLLGQSSKWISCEDARTEIGTRLFHFEPLCLNADDERP